MQGVIVGEQVVLRPAGEGDWDSIAEVLRGPGVEAWWGDFDADGLSSEMSDPSVHPLVIVRGGVVAGYIQYTEVTDPQYRHASIDIAVHDDHDIAVHDDHQGRGYGTDAVRALSRYLLGPGGHHRLTIDPASANERAIRCYRRVGFQPVGVLRQYERGRDGSWHDGLLMDLLADDLT